MSRCLLEHRNCDLERQGENDRSGSGKQDNCSHPGSGGHGMRGETQRPFMGLWERSHPLEVGRVQPVRGRIWLCIAPFLWGHPLRSGFTLASSFPTGQGNAHHQLPHAAGCLLFLVSLPYTPTVTSSIKWRTLESLFWVCFWRNPTKTTSLMLTHSSLSLSLTN